MNIYYLEFEEVFIPKSVPKRYFKIIEQDTPKLIKEIISRLSRKLNFKIIKITDRAIYMESTKENVVDLHVINEILQKVLIDFEKYIKAKYRSNEIIIHYNVRFDKLTEA